MSMASACDVALLYLDVSIRLYLAEEFTLKQPHWADQEIIVCLQYQVPLSALLQVFDERWVDVSELFECSRVQGSRLQMSDLQGSLQMGIACEWNMKYSNQERCLIYQVYAVCCNYNNILQIQYFA